MRKIKSLVAMLMIFAMVLVLGQFGGVSEVYAKTDSAVTVRNAQLVTEMPAELKASLASSTVSEYRCYVANYATVVDVSLAPNELGACDIVNVNATTGSSSGDDEEIEIYNSQRINIGEKFRNNSANAACIFIYKTTDMDSDIAYVFFAQSIAKQMGFSVQGTRTDNENCTMNRLYNPNSGEHFYTANGAEKDYLVSLGWKYEGTGWTAPAYSGTPVYRLYNPNAGDHHYTTNAAERDNLVRVGWKDEGIGWYSNELGTTTLHRLYNPNATGAGAHHYTVNAAEATNLQNLGWKYEGTAWYGL